MDLGAILTWLRANAYVAEWGTLSVAFVALTLDAYFLLWRLYRRLWPIVADMSDDELASIREYRQRVRETSERWRS